MIGVEIPFGSEKHSKIMSALWDRYRASYAKMTEMYGTWRKAEEQTIAYVPDTVDDQLRKAKRNQGIPQYVQIQVPYSYALLQTAHSYTTSVLFGRDPIFQYMARHGRVRNREQAVEALVNYSVTVGRHLVPYYMWTYDTWKYGMGVMGTYWREDYVNFPQIVEQTDPMTGRKLKKKIVGRAKKFEGNKVYNIRPYHFFPDTRKPIHRFQEGEFCGVYVELGWNEVLRRAEAGEYFNIDALKGKGGGRGSNDASLFLSAAKPEDGLPTPHIIRPNPVISLSNPYGGSVSTVGLIEMVVELSPVDWGLGKTTSPEKWIFTFSVDNRVLIGCRPMGYWHDRYPYSIMVLEPEGYGLVSRGMMEIVEPLQKVLDWLVNTHFFNIRSILNNTLVVDPSKIVMSDMLSGEPGGLWRLRPTAYGTDPKLAYSQVLVGDVTQQHMQDMKVVTDLMQRVTGIVDGLMGMPQQTGRKTATEVRGANNFSISRLKTVTEFFSAMGMDNHSMMMLSNCQQFYDEPMSFNVAGDLNGAMGPLLVSPEEVMGEYDYIPVDGTMPVDRYAQANLLREMLMEGAQMPGIMQGFDIPGIFVYIMQLAGVKNINQFKIQTQVLAPGQPPAPGMMPVQAGAGAGFNPEAMAEPGQLLGMGQTG